MRRFVFIPPFLAALSACGGASPSAPTPVPPEDPAPTYAAAVRPLVQQYCVGCHEAGGVAPFELDDYDAARTWAASMASAVRARRMPPFLADASGRCGELRDDGWLSEEEIAVFERWVEAGTPPGDLDAPAPPPRARPALTGDVRRVDIGTDYLPDPTKSDEYRCFVVDAPGAFGVTGFNVVPGNAAIVHHLIAYQVVDETAADAVRRLDEDSPGPGYDCLGTGPGVDAHSVAGWAPGAGAEIFPEGMSVEIAADRPLILEVHYNIAGGPGETDRTALELQVVPPGLRRPMIELIAVDYDFSGAPGIGDFTTTDDFPVSWQLPDGLTGRLQLLSANAHMHKRGVSQRLERVKPNGEIECLLDIPRWDFDWQRTYWYSKPIAIDVGDTLRITCTFDTRGAAAPITWGEGTDDEMCLASFFAVVE